VFNQYIKGHRSSIYSILWGSTLTQTTKQNSYILHCQAHQQRGDYTAKEQAGTYDACVIYFCRHMKKIARPQAIVVFTTFLALSCLLIAFSMKPPALNNASRTASFAQTTPTLLVEEDRSEVGSTDGIIFMGIVIVAIVLIPIIIQRKAWLQRNQS